MDDADLEMTMLGAAAVFVDDLPELEPVIAHGRTEHGWRGLTGDGEIIEVRSANGKPISVPSELTIWQGDRPVGRRQVRDGDLDIDAYLAHFHRAVDHYRANECAAALCEIDRAVALAPTVRARFNRAMILLAMGNWREGLAQYEDRLEFPPPFLRMFDTGDLPRWNGESLAGKRLVLVHEQGFGDTIQQLRFVPMLRALGADVVLSVPPELERLAGQVAPTRCDDADFYCPMLSLLHRLEVTPATVPCEPYLKARPALPPAGARRRIGIAWSIGKPVDGDFPREIPLDQLVTALDPAAQLFSLQMQDGDAARRLGVEVTAFKDFADCAALIASMDEVISVDTAALHAAGALAHPRVTALLSHWASWRWRDNPFYPGIRLCRQQTPGDWASALEQI